MSAPIGHGAGSRGSERQSTYAWQKKRGEIKRRDHYLCVYSLARGRLVYEGLEVHHISPIEERPDLALEDGNLITLSREAHELAGRGEITRGELAELVRYPPGRGSLHARRGPYHACPSEHNKCRK